MFKGEFRPQDALDIEASLTPEERGIRDEARKFVGEVLSTFVEKREVGNARGILRKLGEHGLLQKFWKSATSCPVAFGLICNSIEYLDSGIRTFLLAHGILTVGTISSYATPEIKDKYLLPLQEGKIVGAFGLTEPEHGSDSMNMDSRYRFDEAKGEYILNGCKAWIALANLADVFVILAKDEVSKEVAGFVIDRNTEGLETRELKDLNCMEFCPVGTITLKDCRVKKNAKLLVAGPKAIYEVMNLARYGISWGVLGSAQYSFDLALSHSKQRKSFSRPICSNQTVQIKLTDAVTSISTGLASCLHVGRNMMKGGISPMVVTLLKRDCCRKALNVVRDSRDILGSHEFLGYHRLVHHLVDLEGVNTVCGTEDVGALALGRCITGVQAMH